MYERIFDISKMIAMMDMIFCNIAPQEEEWQCLFLGLANNGIYHQVQTLFKALLAEISLQLRQNEPGRCQQCEPISL